MALSKAQRNAVLEALEVPDSTTFRILTHMGTLQNGVDVARQSQAGALAAIDEALAAIALDTDQENLLKARCDEWIAISGETYDLNNGGVGAVQNISISADKTRERIRERIKIILPYYRYHEFLEKQYQSSGSNGGGIRMIRV